MNKLENLLLKFWLHSGAKKICRNGDMIVYYRGHLTHHELFNDFTGGKMFSSLVDVSKVPEEDIDDYVIPVASLIEDKSFEEKDYHSLQLELLAFWTEHSIDEIVKYKHCVRKFENGELTHLLKDISSGDLFNMVTDIANFAPNHEFHLADVTSKLSGLFLLPKQDFIPLRYEEPAFSQASVLFKDGTTKVIKVDENNKKKALEEMMATLKEGEFNAIRTIHLV